MPLADDLADSVSIVQMFNTEGRTNLRDLLPALEKIDQRLEKYDAVKRSRWRGQSMDTHLWHALIHLQTAASEFIDTGVFTKELTAAALRCLMALTIQARVEEAFIGTVDLGTARECK